jgi:hypothetical protein
MSNNFAENKFYNNALLSNHILFPTKKHLDIYRNICLYKTYIEFSHYTPNDPEQKTFPNCFM